jgi:hypothetical protein
MLRRRANHRHNFIVAKISTARAGKSVAGFFYRTAVARPSLPRRQDRTAKIGAGSLTQQRSTSGNRILLIVEHWLTKFASCSTYSCGAHAALQLALAVYSTYRHSNISKNEVSKLSDLEELFELGPSSLRVKNPEFRMVCGARASW